jgi:hypothetical protein
MTEGATPSSAEEQLAAIASLSSALDQHGVEYWLFGGWAVDFWVGAYPVSTTTSISRRGARITTRSGRRWLRGGGTHRPPMRWSAPGISGGRQVEFTFVIADEDGSILVPLAGQPVVWSTEPFGNGRRELLGVGSRTIPLALLRTGKSFPREGAAEAAKDRADYDALSRLQDEPPS